MASLSRIAKQSSTKLRKVTNSVSAIASLRGRELSTSTSRSNLVESAVSAIPSLPARVEPVRMLIPPKDDPLLEYLTCHIMKHGEKNKAARVVTNMLAEIHRLTEAPPLPILRHAIFLASPSVRIKSHKKSAKSFMIPMPLNDRQRTFFAVKWLVTASKNRNDRSLEHRLAKEVIRIVDGESDVLKKKTEVHKLAVANRSNAVVKATR